VVLEGDEYDTAFFDKRSKFLHYLPEVVVINNLEFDHADIFRDLEDIQTSFRRLVQLVPENGTVLVNADEPNALHVTTTSRAPVSSVGFSESADHRILNARYGKGAVFSFMGWEFELQIPGSSTSVTLPWQSLRPDFMVSRLRTFKRRSPVSKACDADRKCEGQCAE
jgi:UDP-N-acetylmuramate: L-alanyl-gamma-D-glutamyl-meso-diaminopimelate ligase